MIKIIDCYTPWCVACKNIDVIMESIKDIYEKKVEIQKIDMDQHPEIAEKLGVCSVPAVFFLKDGEVQEAVYGVKLLEQYYEILEKLLVEENV